MQVDKRIVQLAQNVLKSSVELKKGGGEIYFDDVLIRKDGRFVLKELQGLNPEKLR